MSGSENGNACLGVPPPQMQAGSGSALYSSLVPRCGVPLRSVTRKAGSKFTAALVLSSGMLLNACQQPAPIPTVAHRPALPTLPFWQHTEHWDTSALGREIDSLTLVLATDPNYAAGFLRRGQLRCAILRPGNDIEDFDRAIHLDSTLAEAYFSRGVVEQYRDSNYRPRNGCKSIQKAASLGFHFPADDADLWSDCLIPEWDTLSVRFLGKFVPLQALLANSTFNLEDRKLIRKCLAERNIHPDSLWINPDRSVHSNAKTIELALYFKSGLLKSTTLGETEPFNDGNWSGRDGTLTINRMTGSSTYLLWQ